MSRLPKMYIYTDTFLADTQDLSDTEFGCYCRLLMFHWGKNCQGLPSDLNKLKRITHSSEEVIKTILSEFFYLEEDKYFNKKQQKEFQEAMEYANKQAENGRRGAEIRWGGYSNPNGDANGNPNGETITTNTNTNTNTNTISNNSNIYPLTEDEKDNNINKGNGVIKKQRTITNYSDDFEDLWKSLSIENRTRSNKPSSFKLYKTLCKEDQELVRKNWKGYQIEQAKENGNFAKALERYIRAETFRISSNQEEKEYKEAW